ncbi:MAG TPA: response regulator transcription factor [Vitreimonas sp.]|uniref:response regulator transcription factor n=1 Tax=Vitreimonas sp. TaxID=3069702 RepID=UPI002D600FA4|nr:response regulator transcription factor [Vitreimonas sp.]HYD89758.1 response regulator transcription factor [Vitreimonas sp.]
MSHRILVVDDDPHIRDVICFAVERAGMNPVTAKDGAEALQRLEAGGADLVVLDIGMPEMDGLEVCRRIRRKGDTPILFLSARSDEVDRIVGLELGGDDYVTKPFSPRELVARIHAILNRSKRAAPAEPAADVLRHGALTLDAPRFQASYAGALVPLTALEFSIVRMLAARPGIVFTRDQIMDAAYADNVHVSDRTIDSHVRNVRAKFAAAGCAAVIETVHGVGFKLGDLGATA